MPALPSAARRAPVLRSLAALVAAATLVIPTIGAVTSADAADLPRPPSAGGEVVFAGSDTLVPTAAATVTRFGVITAELIAASPPPAPSVYCPAPGAEFVDSWGFARSGGRRHQGVDMMAPHGTPVLAPVSGTVRHSVNDLGGLSFYLVDPAGNEFYGAHLQSLGPDGAVEAGTVLGTVGSSGNASASGPHLHFEISPAGAGSVNPYPFVEAWCDGAANTVGTAAELPLP